MNATPLAGEPFFWVGDAGGGTWDTGTTAHWKNAGGDPVFYSVFTPVVFDDTAAGGLITLAEPDIQPFSVTFANDTLPYVLSGEAWSGPANLVKNGSGEVTLLIENNLAATTINAGTLRIGYGGVDGSPGTGAITINDGSLVIQRDGLVALANELSGDGALEIQGPGTTIVSNSTLAGTTTVSGGTLRTTGTLASPIVGGGGGTLAPGAAASPGTLGVPALTLEAGSRTIFRAGFSTGDVIEIADAGGLSINGSHSIDLIPTET